METTAHRGRRGRAARAKRFGTESRRLRRDISNAPSTYAIRERLARPRHACDGAPAKRAVSRADTCRCRGDRPANSTRRRRGESLAHCAKDVEMALRALFPCKLTRACNAGFTQLKA